MVSRRRKIFRSSRQGSVLTYACVAVVAFTCLASLGIDVAHVRLVKRQLQTAADAAARYAIIGFGVNVATAQSNAASAAHLNNADGAPVVLNTNTDVEFGTWDSSSKTFTVLGGVAQNTATAIRVTTRRTAATNNAVSLAFGGLIGKSSCDVIAQAIAVNSTYGFSIVGINSLITTKSGASGNRAVHIDSWNSASGAYGTYPVDNYGNCSSNGSISLVSGTVIHGSCEPGTGQSVSMTGSTVTGSTAPLNYSLDYPAPNPGPAATSNNNSNLPSAYFNSSTRDFIVPNNQSLTLPGGTYYVNNVSWQNTTFVFTGPVVFYVTGVFFTHNNYITTYQNLPKNLKFEITTATTVTYDFDQACNAVLYAPLANVTTLGLADDYGAVVGYNLNMSVGWHVDEALSGAGVTGKVSMVQ